MDTLHPGNGELLNGVSKELGEADSKDLRSGPSDLPELLGKEEDHQLYSCLPTGREDEEVIEKILKHLGLWDMRVRLPPRAKGVSVRILFDDSESQILSPGSFYAHPDYSIDSCMS